jgi:UDP-N-acetylglucosamine--N-acetylmuramyl-(pentapeptide) pyrophosphoryl-undecaprenol N-acetylglucosamine transferase
MPVRPAVLAKRDARYPSLFGHGPVTLLVFGGSQGARIFSELVPKAVLLLPETLQRRLLIEQQCRAEDMDHVKQLYHRHGISADLRLFFDDMPARMANAHLIISRAGASTVAELEVIGRPAILVPYPHAIDDHQTANAQAFSEAGGGWMMPQSMMTAENLAQHLQSLLTAPEKLQSAARHAHRAAIPDATARLADLVVGLTEAAA